MKERSLRVLIVDNSATVRAMLSTGLHVRGIEVVGEAADGTEALQLCRSLRPDVMSLDLVMDGLDGMATLRELRTLRLAVPVVVVSSIASGDRALRLLEAGAVEVLAKPAPGSPLETFLDDYAEQLRVAAAVNADALWADEPAADGTHRPVRLPAGDRRLVVVAASTGGPRALHVIAMGLPPELGRGLLVVQHMPPNFTGQLARRLDACSALRFAEAHTGDRIRPERALVAAGGKHLCLADRHHVRTTDDPPIGALRPRADVTIRDAVEQYGSNVLLVVLTGMGRDGLEGARAVKAHGGVVLVEASETALIDGMPAAVRNAGLADDSLPVRVLADAICRAAG